MKCKRFNELIGTNCRKLMRFIDNNMINLKCYIKGGVRTMMKARAKAMILAKFFFIRILQADNMKGLYYQIRENAMGQCEMIRNCKEFTISYTI